MYRNILIFSDNLFLSNKFNKLINNLKLTTYNWTFATSPFSNNVEFAELLQVPVEVYNLKNIAHVETIVSTYDLVFSLHCKQMFPDVLINKIKCINVHPGYNPVNRGWYPQVFAIINDLPIGATIHEMDCELDNGPIIARSFVEKTNIDTSKTLYDKVVLMEIQLLKENLKSILSDNYVTFLPENKGNLTYKHDFDNLCELDLDEQLTVRELINKLRALTHGEYKNAYFIDSNSKNKIYVSINFMED